MFAVMCQASSVHGVPHVGLVFFRVVCEVRTRVDDETNESLRTLC